MKTSESFTKEYFAVLHEMKTRDLAGDWRQWISDMYHCSDCWGQPMTEEEMLLDLAETRRQADPDDYVPDIMLYRECTAYWNELCELYPN